MGIRKNSKMFQLILSFHQRTMSVRKKFNLAFLQVSHLNNLKILKQKKTLLVIFYSFLRVMSWKCDSECVTSWPYVDGPVYHWIIYFRMGINILRNTCHNHTNFISHLIKWNRPHLLLMLYAIRFMFLHFMSS